MVPHPQDESRPLFLSFDYCHIIKNVRNQFLARQFEFGKKIEKRYIELLYEQQKTELLRPLRRMGLKTLDPNNLEKQNVQLALDIFSMEVTSLLESKLFNAESEFEGCEETLTFLRNFTSGSPCTTSATRRNTFVRGCLTKCTSLPSTTRGSSGSREIFSAI